MNRPSPDDMKAILDAEGRVKTEEMETLLTKLIEKWRKPFGLWWCPNRLTNYDRKHNRMWFEAVYCIWEDEYDYDYKSCSLRQLVSIESWFWQFVCENGMVALKLSARMKNPRIDWEDVDDYNNWHIVMNYKQKCEWDKAEYRLIESALTDEDKLEDFILSNIKLD